MKTITRFIQYIDPYIAAWMGRHGIKLLRMSVGVVFFWFGFLKFFPGLSPAEALAGRTIEAITGGFLMPSQSLPILATWECLIGLGLLSGVAPRTTLLLLFLQMPGTLLPLFLFPLDTWVHAPFIPTLAGQYIIKNLVLISAGIVIGATVRGARIDPPHPSEII